MNDLEFVALLPRQPGVSLEQMVIELWIARTGHEPTEQEWMELQPRIDELSKMKAPFILRSKKFRG